MIPTDEPLLTRTTIAMTVIAVIFQFQRTVEIHSTSETVIMMGAVGQVLIKCLIMSKIPLAWLAIGLHLPVRSLLSLGET